MEFVYMNKINEILEKVKTYESENIMKACELVTNAVINKNSLFIFGASHAGIIAEEVFFRAGGLMLFNPVFAKALSLDSNPISITSQMERLEGHGTILAKKTPIKPNDIVFVHSVSGRNPVSIEFAIESKNMGATVIGLTNVKYSKSVTSRHSSNKNLYQVCDLVIDNHGDIGDASMKLEGLEQKVGATSTVIGAAIMNTIVTEVTKMLIEKDLEVLPIFYSANLDGGDDMNQKAINEYKDLIHYDL